MSGGSDYDVVIIGGGPGGYAAALYGASAGLSIALVEDDALGGTCLNRGCIPAKALLQTAEVHRTANHAGDFGIVADGVSTFSADWSKVATRTTGIVDRLVGGLAGLIKRRKVDLVTGRGRLTSSGGVSVDGKELRGKAVIIATGSVPRSIPGFEFDGELIVSSDHSTRSSSLPERVAVIGGGVIGSEFASVYTDVGVQTTLLEALPGGVLPIGPDPELAGILSRALVKRGTKIHAQAMASPPEKSNGGLVLGFETKDGSEKIEVDQVLVATGRRPVTEDMGLTEAGVRVSDKGFIEVDTTTMATTKPGVYAVGDVVDTPGLAHVAYAEAIVAIKAILGENPLPVDYDRVPWVVYTHPEVAWAGYTEAAAKAAGYDVVVHKHKFAGNGRAMIIGDTDGLVKIVAERNGPLLGAHIVGPWASELISESYLAINWQALPEEVGAFIHAHPSLSEAVGETMLALTGRSLHG
ncbi:dihydrolipoyl dehydrogenase [[Mycobacterium] crassicus]|uniref:Dihydrolipoyl dehydrogenase n=1 Tax=[Mycobacterium] crassicus TaxID=2872309 RepID=A0ABU5XJH4_9MYCO|nr:dihydrolipoyl dehydrogenase [Mycolicibacter sp. MYC098]MEB3022113.1 dihydrolipoyl dehydrogenase [Mycolicibacter sp. MYC098]